MAGKRESKSAKHEAKGDSLAEKGKHAKAVKEYRKALDIDPENERILEKLIRARDMDPGEWGVEDFADSVGWTMKKQEKENPSIRQVHPKLAPEWMKAYSMAVEILSEEDEGRLGERIEKLAAMGEIATRATIGLLLDIRNSPPADDESQEQPDVEP